jgi:hypothetical protein
MWPVRFSWDLALKWWQQIVAPALLVVVVTVTRDPLLRFGLFAVLVLPLLERFTGLLGVLLGYFAVACRETNECEGECNGDQEGCLVHGC